MLNIRLFFLPVLTETHLQKNGETHFQNAKTHFKKGQNSFLRDFYTSPFWQLLFPPLKFNLTNQLISNTKQLLISKMPKLIFKKLKLISKMPKLISKTPKLISKTPKLISRLQKLISQMAETHSRGVWLEWPRLDFAQKKACLEP